MSEACFCVTFVQGILAGVTSNAMAKNLRASLREKKEDSAQFMEFMDITKGHSKSDRHKIASDLFRSFPMAALDSLKQMCVCD